MAKYMIHNCLDCGKPRRVLILHNQPRFLRCQKCANRSRVYDHFGEKHPGWKGGRHITKKGYVYIRLLPDDFFYPMVKKNGYVLEHRLVMAKHLGRLLQPWEKVHHKDGIKGHNEYSNLEIKTASSHMLEHSKGYRDGYRQGYEDGQSNSIKELKEQIRLLQWEIRQVKELASG